MSAALVLPDLTEPEAFVAWMEEQPAKLEMAGGRLVMMAGGTNWHARIAGNTYVALDSRLRGGPCLPFNSDFMVQITPRDRYYPDVSVACHESRNYTDRPVMVVEILSDTTERFDFKTKLPAYLGKPGLTYVLYLSQDGAKAWLYRPGTSDADQPAEFAGLDAEVSLPELGLTLPLAELYRNVTFAAPKPTPASRRDRRRRQP